MNANPSVALLFCLLLSGCASSPPGPEAQLREADRSPYVVLVEGEGATEEKAREAAIRNAIDKVAGSLVLTDQKVSNGKVIRNDVSTHRSAYVSETEIVETSQPSPKKYRVKLWAKVTGSALFSRSIPIPAGSQALDGTAVAEQLKAVLAFKQEGDRMLQRTIEAYPLNAFKVTVENGAVNLDEQRKTQLRIKLRVEWHRLYVDALREASNTLAIDRSECNLLTAALFQQGNDWNSPVPVDRQGKPLAVTGLCGEFADLTIIRRESGSMLPRVYGYSFGDVTRLSLLSKRLSAPMNLQLSLESEGGRQADVFCETMNSYPLINFRSAFHYQHEKYNNRALERPEIRELDPWIVDWPLVINDLDKFKKIKRITAKVVAHC